MNDFYYELTVRPSAHLELFADHIQTLFGDAIELGEEELIVRSESSVERLAEAAIRYAEVLSQRTGERVTVETRTQKRKNVDWIAAYRQAIRPVAVGSFYVHPSWEPPREGKRNICIDPALAFGSGHHETTASCLEAIESYVRPRQTVLDVGCGSGILGIAAAKLGAIVDACDTDALAVENARKNFRLNEAAFRRIWEGSAAATRERYDVVVANIVADVLVMIAPDLKARVKEGGLLILSGILDTKEERVAERFGDLTLLKSLPRNEWRTQIYKKQG